MCVSTYIYIYVDTDRTKHLTVLCIDALHGDVTFGYFRIHVHPFSLRHVGGQKCIAVIERKALNVLLFTNASDYSSETTIFVRYKHIDLSMQVLLE